MQSICILDGDQKNKADYGKYIIALPGDKSPEELIFDYSISLSKTNDPFWDEEAVQRLGFYKTTFVDNIKPDIDNISNEIKKIKEEGESTKGKTRELNKNVFKKHISFFILLYKHWVNNPTNKKQMDKFYKDLQIMFQKTARFHAIDPRLWEDE